MKYLVIGGNASGASFATRMRRIDDHAEIVIINQGPYISYASCAMPYYLGGVIDDRNKLIERTPEGLSKKSNIDVRVNQTATKVNVGDKTVTVYDQKMGTSYDEDYDVLLISTGMRNVNIEIPGLADAKNVFSLFTIPDADKIKKYIDDENVKTATIIGTGTKGLEIAENLVKLGIKVTMINHGPDIDPPYDPEITQIVRQTLAKNGVDLNLNVEAAEVSDSGKTMTLSDGSKLEQDMILVTAGGVYNTDFLKGSPIELSEAGQVIVDDRLKTSVDDIYATGDIILTKNYLSDKPIGSVLSGPANRQGHLLADNLGGQNISYKFLPTAVSQVFDQTVSYAGYTRQMLEADGITDYQWLYITPFNHPAYFPGASRINFELIFDSKTGQILGGEAIGVDGADKLIGELSMALYAKMTIFDLAAAPTPYSPPYSTPRSPLNIAAYVAINLYESKFNTVRPDDIKTKDNFYLDVRELGSKETGTIAATRNIPASELKFRLDEIPTDKHVYITFHPGTANYQAARLLAENGIHADVIME